LEKEEDTVPAETSRKKKTCIILGRGKENKSDSITIKGGGGEKEEETSVFSGQKKKKKERLCSNGKKKGVSR